VSTPTPGYGHELFHGGHVPGESSELLLDRVGLLSERGDIIECAQERGVQELGHGIALECGLGAWNHARGTQRYGYAELA